MLTGYLPDGCTLAQFVRELDAATGAYAEARDAYIKAGYLTVEQDAPILEKTLPPAVPITRTLG